MSEQDVLFMNRTLALAAKGKGYTAPNPLVGAVLVCQDRIIGEGYHVQYGQSHAEVNAINAVKDKSLLKTSILYVNLEPCSHSGKTPPCSDFILEHQIPKVVVATLDSNPKVAGKGIEKLRNNGIEVITGILETQARELNKRFFCFHEQKRPYIILKWAQSIDGYMDVNPRKAYARKNYWISNEQMRKRVHQWRAEESAIFVGMNTLINDNPRLNVRFSTGKNPIRITMDTKKISFNMLDQYCFFDNTQVSFVFHYGEESRRNNTFFYHISPAKNPIKQILDKLHELGVNSLIVEGGKETLETFLKNNFWDEIRIIEGNICFGDGLKAPHLPYIPHKLEQIESNRLLIYKNTNI